MEIVVLGLSHKSAPVGVREKVSFAGEKLASGLAEIRRCPSIAEVLIVSTCNRVETYAVSSEGGETAREELSAFFSSFHGVPREALDPHLYFLGGADAVRHVFRVASSLDSMMVGEPQILGQVKDAYACAARVGATGNTVNRLLQQAFSVAKRVRTETRVASSAVSISFAAVELARKIFGDLSGKSVMLIGAGEMAELAARHLLTNGVGRIMVANRTYERAQALAASFDGEAVRWEELAQQLEAADIVISSTGAPHVIIDRPMMEDVIHRRRNRPMFLIDIAVPRDIAGDVNDIENVYSYDIDDLQTVVDANLKTRQEEAARAEGIVREEVEEFLAYLRSRDAFPTIVRLREWMEGIRRAELDKGLRKLEKLDPGDRARVEALTEAIVNKILHRPITQLKRAHRSREEMRLAEAVRRIFDLEHPEEDK